MIHWPAFVLGVLTLLTSLFWEYRLLFFNRPFVSQRIHTFLFASNLWVIQAGVYLIQNGITGYGYSWRVGLFLGPAVIIVSFFSYTLMVQPKVQQVYLFGTRMNFRNTLMLVGNAATFLSGLYLLVLAD